MTITTLVTLILVGLPGRADLRGTVTTPDGEQVSGALVVIDTAAVKKGTSPLCPSCYPDCGKRAESAADGSFEIKGLDADLTFRVLVIGDGYQAKQVKSVDPGKGPMNVQVERLDLAKLDPKRILRGVVLDPNGRPVVGASLEPESFKTDAYHGFSPGILDPLAVTNKNGEFVMTSKSPISYVNLRVKARGLAPRIFPKRLIEENPQRLQMTPGVDVTGRVLLGKKPLDDVNIGLVQVDRGMEHFLGATQVGTDRTGRFLFTNVAPGDQYFVYGIMSSLKDRGSIKVRPIATKEDGSTIDVGDLVIEPAHRIGGTVLLSDKKPVPAGTRIIVSRDQAWDSQEVVLGPDGSFSFQGLPNEQVLVNVFLKNYHLSRKNKTLDPHNPWQMMGTVDQDIPGLKILMDPGGR